VPALAREGYSRLAFDSRDAFEVLTFPGFWRLAWRYWPVGLGEIWRSLNKRAFVRALRHLVPTVEASDLAPGGCGVWAQALAANGALVDDFRIVESGPMIHVLNAPSPAATASLAIGDAIADLALARFRL
jgi:L-2-hydroxyglutarate oxidase LhgO